MVKIFHGLFIRNEQKLFIPIHYCKKYICFSRLQPQVASMEAGANGNPFKTHPGNGNAKENFIRDPLLCDCICLVSRLQPQAASRLGRWKVILKPQE